MLRPRPSAESRPSSQNPRGPESPGLSLLGKGAPTDRLCWSVIPFLPQLPGVWFNGHRPAWDLGFGLYVPCGCCGLSSYAQTAWDPAIDCRWIPLDHSSLERLPAMGRVARLEPRLCAG